MKKKMGNKIVALLLSAAMAVGIGGAGKPIYAADRANGKNTGRQAVKVNKGAWRTVRRLRRTGTAVKQTVRRL